MYSTAQICDRLTTTPEKLEHIIELIEDAGYECNPTFVGNEVYYTTEAVGWMMQLKKLIDSGLAQDFVAEKVEEGASATYPAGKKKKTHPLHEVKPSIPYKISPPEPVVMVESDRPDKLLSLSPPSQDRSPSLDPNIISAIAVAVAEHLGSKQSQADVVGDRLKLQKLLRDAIKHGYDLSTQDVKDICNRTPKAKVNGFWYHGSFEFQYLGKGLWKPLEA